MEGLSSSDRSVIYNDFDFLGLMDYPSMKMRIHHPQRASHGAARMYLVFCDLSSRVSKTQLDRLRGTHGVSDRSPVRVDMQYGLEEIAEVNLGVDQ
jgi:hypothetical protein